MALRWRVNDVEDFETLCYFEDEDGETHLEPVTEVLLWATMAVGLGSITETNWREFYARLHIHETLSGGGFISEGGEYRHISPHEVRDHIGLATNVADEDREDWSIRYMRGRVQEELYNARRV